MISHPVVSQIMKGKVDPPLLRLLKDIEERNFGPIELLDQGEDVPDSDLLNGFMEGFNSEEEDLATAQPKQSRFILMVTIVIVTGGILLYHIRNSLTHDGLD